MIGRATRQLRGSKAIIPEIYKNCGHFKRFRCLWPPEDLAALLKRSSPNVPSWSRICWRDIAAMKLAWRGVLRGVRPLLSLVSEIVDIVVSAGRAVGRFWTESLKRLDGLHDPHMGQALDQATFDSNVIPNTISYLRCHEAVPRHGSTREHRRTAILWVRLERCQIGILKINKSIYYYWEVSTKLNL